jgi:simple sugar transport system ATP-binding protein
MQLADRIAVMYRGKFIAVLSAEEATKEKVGLLMAGVAPEEAGIQSENSDPEGEKVSAYDE